MIAPARMKTSRSRYYEHDDYHTKVPGYWFGSGASALGLSGVVDPEDFRKVFSGFAPDGRKLVQNAGRATVPGQERIGHRQGFEVAHNLSKSTSILAAILDHSEQNKIVEAELDTVRTCFEILEPHIGWCRSGKGGQHIQRASLTVAIFQHSTSREGQPHRHSHSCIANVGLCEDGRTRALYSRPIFQWKMAWGALARNEMAYRLQRDLGLALVRTQHGYEIAWIAGRLIREFSKRRQQIEARLIQGGWHSAKAAENAARNTRKPKQNIPIELLRETWLETCRQFGLTPETARALLYQAPIPELSSAQLKTCISESIANITESQSHFTLREVVRSVAEELLGKGISSADLFCGVQQYLHRSHDIIHLLEIGLERQYTTRKVIDLEADFLLRVDELHSQQSYAVPDEKVEQVLCRHPGIQERPEQVAALKHILSEGALKTLCGKPGTGKTYVLNAGREGWEGEGNRVIGTALAGRAANELQEKAHIPCFTVRQLLDGLEPKVGDTLKHDARQLYRAATGRTTYAQNPYRLDSNTVLIIDETSMLGTVELNAIIKHALEAGCKVVLVGDPQQLPAIAAGGPFQAILERYPTVELEEIERQKGPNKERDIKAIHALSRGDARDALRHYQERGLVAVEKDRRSAVDRLVQDWAERGGIRKPSSHAILVCTNADCIALNDRCQKARFDAGELQPDNFFTVRRRSDVEGQGNVILREDLHVGDRIMFLRRSLLYGIENGQFATVTSYDREAGLLSVLVERPDAKATKVEISVAKYQDFTLGYAATTHKFQGATVDHAYALMGGSMQSREMTYTQLSRAIYSTHIYVDALEAGENLQGLIAQMERSDAKLLAHDLLPSKHIPVPPPLPVSIPNQL